MCGKQNKTEGRRSPSSPAECHAGLLCTHTPHGAPWQAGGPCRPGILSFPRPRSSRSASGEDGRLSAARQGPPLPGLTRGLLVQPSRNSPARGGPGAGPTGPQPRGSCTCSCRREARPGSGVPRAGFQDARCGEGGLGSSVLWGTALSAQSGARDEAKSLHGSSWSRVCCDSPWYDKQKRQNCPSREDVEARARAAGLPCT